MPTPDVAAARGRSLRYRVPCLACKLTQVTLHRRLRDVCRATGVPSPCRRDRRG